MNAALNASVSSKADPLRQTGFMAGLVMIALFPSLSRGQAAAAAYTAVYRYDAGRHLVGMIKPDPDGSGPILFAATRNTYDARGVLTRVEEGELATWQPDTVAPNSWTGYTVFRQTDYTYDGSGRKLSEELSSGGVAYALKQYSYDIVGRLDCTAVRMNTAQFAADIGSLSACQLGTQGTDGPDRISRTGSYDTSDRPLSMIRGYGTSDQQDYATYTYSGGHIASLKDADGNVEAFQVDGLARPSFWYFPSPTTKGQTSTTDYEKFGYDAVYGSYASGDRINQTSLRKRDGNVINYQFDALNRLVFKDILNRPGFPGDSNMREDGVYGNSEAVFGGSAGAGCPAGA